MAVIKKNISFDEKEAIEIIQKAQLCFLACCKDNIPYNVPLNFGYEHGYFYFHSGPGGKKFEFLESNNRVSLAMSVDEKLHFRHQQVGCSYSMIYKSLIADGNVEFITENSEKARLLNLIMKQYTSKDDFVFSKPSLDNVVVFKMKIDNISIIKRIYG